MQQHTQNSRTLLEFMNMIEDDWNWLGHQERVPGKQKVDGMAWALVMVNNLVVKCSIVKQLVVEGYAANDVITQEVFNNITNKVLCQQKIKGEAHVKALAERIKM